MLKLSVILIWKHQNSLYICNRLDKHIRPSLGNGEILKRPTRADCKSAVKTSQVRILLSPLFFNDLNLRSFFFVINY